jgi:hypothetical protein
MNPLRSQPARLGLLLLATGLTVSFRSAKESEDGAMFGCDPTLIHDWDGDGERDYAVGAPFAYERRGHPRGAVVIVSGKTFEPITIMQGAEQIDSIGRQLVALADMDGDGHGEVGVGGDDLFQVYGHEGKVLWSMEESSTCLASSWDVNADSLPDVLVRRGTTLGILSAKDGEWLGNFAEITGNGLVLEQQDCIEVLGDLDEDGFDDFVVVPCKSAALHVYSGRKGTKLASLMMLEGMSRDSLSGFSATCYDIDSDGQKDIILGMPNWRRNGGVLAFAKGDDRVLAIHAFEEDPLNVSFEGGYCVRMVDVAGVGPVLIAGVHGFPNSLVRAFLFDGSVLWTLTLADALASIGAGQEIYDFGTETEVVPDRDGDGSMDILTGTSQWMMGGNTHPGRLFLVSSKTGNVLAGLKEEDCLH